LFELFNQQKKLLKWNFKKWSTWHFFSSSIWKRFFVKILIYYFKKKLIFDMIIIKFFTWFTNLLQFQIHYDMNSNLKMLTKKLQLLAFVVISNE
jgi:hypothetical protein